MGGLLEEVFIREDMVLSKSFQLILHAKSK